MSRYFGILCLAVLALICVGSQARATKLGNEFRVNNHRPGGQDFPDVAVLKNGEFVVVWQSRDQDGHERGIYGRRFDRRGVAIDREFRVNSYTTNDQINAAVAALKDGGFVVTWDNWNRDGTGWSIYAQRYNANGRRIGREFRVNTFAADHQQWSRVISLNDGGFFVVWSSRGQFGTGHNIVGQRFGADGRRVGPDIRINTSNRQNNNAVTGAATLKNGNFVVVWASVSQAAARLYAQRFNAKGRRLGGEFRVDDVKRPAILGGDVAALKSGGFAIIWHVDKGRSFPWPLPAYWIQPFYVQRFAADGRRVGGAIGGGTRLFEIEWQRPARVAGLDDGGFVVTWDDARPYEGAVGTDVDVYARTFAPNGQFASRKFQVNSYDPGVNMAPFNDGQTAPAVAVTKGGHYIITWMSHAQDGDGGGIYAQRFK